MYERSVTERRRLPHRRQSLVKSTALALGMSSLLWGGAAFAGDVPGQLERVLTRYVGSGCPPGSVRLIGDSTGFTLVFAEYTVSVGPGIPISENRKYCNLILGEIVPPGWSFAIFSVDYRGFADLDDKVVGTERIVYFFEGEFPSAVLRSDLVGPFDDNYEIRDTLGLEGLVWSPCGVNRALNINTERRVNNQKNKHGFGLMTADSISGVLSFTFGITWRRC